MDGTNNSKPYFWQTSAIPGSSGTKPNSNQLQDNYLPQAGNDHGQGSEVKKEPSSTASRQTQSQPAQKTLLQQLQQLQHIADSMTSPIERRSVKK